MKTNYLENTKNLKKIIYSNMTLIFTVALLFTLIDLSVNYISKYFIFLGGFIYVFIKLKYFEILNDNIKLRIFKKYKESNITSFFLKENITALKQTIYVFIIILLLLILLYFIIRLKSNILILIYAIYVALVFININTYFISLIKKDFKDIFFKDSLKILNIFKIKEMILKSNYFNTFMWIIIQFIYASIALLFFNLATMELFHNVSYVLNFVAYVFIVINIFNDYIYYKTINLK
jgi:hypothetical protein